MEGTQEPEVTKECLVGAFEEERTWRRGSEKILRGRINNLTCCRYFLIP